MQISFMSRIDKTLGMVLIPLLYVISKVFSALRQKKGGAPSIHKAKKVLIQKYLGMGSIINILPLVQSIRMANPDVKIIFSTFASNKELLGILNIADEVYFIRNSSLPVFVLDVLRAIFSIRRQKIDISLDMEFYTAFSKIFAYFSNAPVMVGFFARDSYKSLLVTHPVSYNHYMHISRIFFAFAEVIGINSKEMGDFENKVFFPSLRSQWETSLDRSLGLQQGDSIITINVVASDLVPLRRWPKRNYIELISFLTRRYPSCKIVLVGLGRDREYVTDIIDAIANRERVINAAGQTNLGQLFALLEKSVLLISNDSGPAHIAAGYNTNSVILFGPETPVLYKPLNKNVAIVYKGIYCSPCIYVVDNKSYDDCRTVECMNFITVDEVKQVVEARFGMDPKRGD